MDLLDKFDAVDIRTDQLISESDKSYCEQHQDAYEAAISSYKELAFFWEDMVKIQDDLLGPRDDNYQANYLTSSSGPKISTHAIEEHIESLHKKFIQAVVHHFNSEYNVTVSAEDVVRALLPEEPEHSRRYDTDAWDEYHQNMQTLTIQYSDVVDQIITRLDGRNFMEQALFELKERCHNAAWNTYRQEPEFERKKDVIRFTGYGCSCDTWYSNPRWELSEDLKAVLRGVAHFETGSYKMYPLGISELVGFGRVESDTIEFPTCAKLKRLKMFKNRRVDLKFTSAALAEEFVNTYLGTVC